MDNLQTGGEGGKGCPAALVMLSLKRIDPNGTCRADLQPFDQFTGANLSTPACRLTSHVVYLADRADVGKFISH
jgi:hypothetical protein